MKNNKILLYFVIGIACLLSFSLTQFQQTKAPVCLNADEAAFAYNAYSILKTGRDEYGVFLPLRLKSFGDYKMPLYTYLSVPFIQLFGLNEQGARAANSAVALFFPLAVFLLAIELFGNKKAATAAAFISATSLGLHVIARQAHEAYVSAFIITLATYFFVRLLKKPTMKRLVPFLTMIFLSLISYQSGRLFAFFFLAVFTGYTLVKKTNKKVLIVAIVVTGIFLLPDLVYKPARVGNLLFYKSAGLGMKTFEFRSEGGTIALYNKVTVATRDFLSNHLEYYSPQFLTTRGDTNYRFGFPDMSAVTVVEYLLAIVGMYYLFKTKERYRGVLVGLLLIAPLAGSLSWAGASISRTLYLLVLISVVAGFGFAQISSLYKNKTGSIIFIGLVGVQLFLLIYGWDIYLNHYPKRAIVIRSQQCGYKELAELIDKKYSTTNSIYVTAKHGQPYIFQLFYDKVTPEKYQKSATLSTPDEYGFGQVLSYDKYHYAFPATPPAHSVIVGYPDDFTENTSYTKYLSQVKKIRVGTEEIFWILETK